MLFLDVLSKPPQKIEIASQKFIDFQKKSKGVCMEINQKKKLGRTLGYGSNFFYVLPNVFQTKITVQFLSEVFQLFTNAQSFPNSVNFFSQFWTCSQNLGGIKKI